MTTSMEMIDQMAQQAAADQVQAAAVNGMADEDTTMFGVTGVQLNKQSMPVTIYQRETGEPRTMPRLAAGIALAKKYRNPEHPLFGQYIFSPTQTKEYHWGTNKCLLHQTSPNRAQYDTWGLPVCTSEHLASPGEVRRHMRLRHTSAEAIIKEEDIELKRQQGIDAQNATAAAVRDALLVLAGKAPETPEEVAVAEAVAEAEQVAPEATGEVITATAFSEACKVCEHITTSDDEQKFYALLREHNATHES